MKRAALSLFLTLFVLPGVLFHQARARTFTPVAHRRAEVVVGHARFTILFPNVVRLEWSADGHFENRATLLVIHRRFPIPPFKVEHRHGHLLILTQDLRLVYRPSAGPFTKRNLQITYRTPGGRILHWWPGKINGHNLKGTVQTLDGTNGPIALRRGVLSRAGWTVLNDSERPVFVDVHSRWPWVRARTTIPHVDEYFFGYGHDYRLAMREFVALSGRMPLPPKWAFGIWRSRWWVYTDRDLMHLVRGYRERHLPLDVVGIDMDWHIVDKPRDYPGPSWFKGKRRLLDPSGQPYGWTGYTWNKDLFPDPREFLAWMHRRHLKVFLNLHPASGVMPWEQAYPAMARAMGIDPASRRYIPFQVTNRRFVENYFHYVIDPLDRQGVDFWWIDWQQWEKTPVAHLRELWWINYVFYHHMALDPHVRPIVYSRWGGWGAQRYNLGFSGDTRATWRTLRFQPYFTATAANVAFGYWGNDIGGYYSFGPTNPQMFTRWVEFGILGPIFKVHYWINPVMDRRPWHLPWRNYDILYHDYRFRQELVPYLYTAAHRAFLDGVAIVHPLYYDDPKAPAAYRFHDEYFLGHDLLVRPVTHPFRTDRFWTHEKVWLPPGRWISWQTGRSYRGPRLLDHVYTLSRIPLYVRAGSAIPMGEPIETLDRHPWARIRWRIFPGRRGGGVFYDDAGTNQAYRQGAYTLTRLRFVRHGRRETIVIGPTRGHYRGMRTRRAYTLILVDTLPPRSVFLDGNMLPERFHHGGIGWRYRGGRVETRIRLPRLPVTRRIVVSFDWSHAHMRRRVDRVRTDLMAFQRVFVFARLHDWPDWRFRLDHLAARSEAGWRVTLAPKLALRTYRRFPHEIAREIHELSWVSRRQPEYWPLLLWFETVTDTRAGVH